MMLYNLAIGLNGIYFEGISDKAKLTIDYFFTDGDTKIIFSYFLLLYLKP